MARISESKLSDELRRAAALVPVGTAYAHYKQPDHTYRIVGHTILEADDTVAVIYKAEYGEGITFARTLTSWLEAVEWQGRSVPRFHRTT